jgi:malate permease and related proteins
MIFTLALLSKILPLYVVMGLGYAIGRKLQHAGQILAAVQIFYITPLIVFFTVAKLDFTWSLLALPLLAYLMRVVIAALFLRLIKPYLGDASYYYAYVTASQNTGYLGVPIALIVFAPEYVGIYMLMLVGSILYEGTLGYYLCARSKYSMQESLLRVVRLPTFYAAIIGLGAGAVGFVMPEFLQPVARDLQGAYVVLGALMIGIGMAAITRLTLNWSRQILLLNARYVMWPVFTIALIVIDQHWLLWFDNTVHLSMLLMALLPAPANAVAFAITNQIDPGEAALQIVITTLLTLAVVPLGLMLAQNYGLVAFSF